MSRRDTRDSRHSDARGRYGAGVDRPPLTLTGCGRSPAGPARRGRRDRVDQRRPARRRRRAGPQRAGRRAPGAGRGRLDRSWTSPPRAGLTFSVLLRPAAPSRPGAGCRCSPGSRCTRRSRTWPVSRLALKWPNDLLAGPDERKLAGILAQTSGAAVVIGIGLNVSTTARRTAGRAPPPRSRCAAPADVDRTDVARRDPGPAGRAVRPVDDVAGTRRRAGWPPPTGPACATLGRPVRGVAGRPGGSLDGDARSTSTRPAGCWCDRGR